MFYLSADAALLFYSAGMRHIFHMRQDGLVVSVDEGTMRLSNFRGKWSQEKRIVTACSSLMKLTYLLLKMTQSLNVMQHCSHKWKLCHCPFLGFGGQFTWNPMTLLTLNKEHTRRLSHTHTHTLHYLYLQRQVPCRPSFPPFLSTSCRITPFVSPVSSNDVFHCLPQQHHGDELATVMSGASVMLIPSPLSRK